MRLSALLVGIPHESSGSPADPDILSITHDSRKVAPGALFAALPGLSRDGREFLHEALRRGAAAALGPAPTPVGIGMPYVQVQNPRREAGVLAARLSGDPAGRLLMVGITGTSGKTTVSLLIDQMLEEAHPARGLFGTLVYRGAGGERAALSASRTTPEATELQPMLAALVAEGGTAAVLECSSHALVLQRLAGCAFDVGVFTNLSRDHLDFHRDMDDYFEAKAALFQKLKPRGWAVVNAGDPWGQRLLQSLAPERSVSFALAGQRSADVMGRASLGSTRTVLDVERASTGESFRVSSALLGRPNAENLLAAAAVGLTLGLPTPVISRLLSSVAKVPGRLESIPNAAGLTVLVDYAHKPGALEGVLHTCRALATASGGRLLVVFGCGGDRDRGKRPEMGRIAATLADEVYLTSDNPRSEDPAAILAQIHQGVLDAGGTAAVQEDRRVAIAEALRHARPGDVVLLAGKGHEAYQELAGRSLPFDDRRVARELLSELFREVS